MVVEEQNEDENLEGDVNDRLIEWLQDELSETESDILAQSKGGELSKRKLKIFPINKKPNQAQEDSSLKKGVKR